MSKKYKSKNELFEFMKQFDDNNLPDGARQAVLENAVEQYNEANNTHYDPFDLWLEYVEKSSNFKKKNMPDYNRLYMLLDDMITEIEKQQKDELTANESPVKIADTIRGLDAMKSALYRVSDKWKELGITHNLGPSIRL